MLSGISSITETKARLVSAQDHDVSPLMGGSVIRIGQVWYDETIPSKLPTISALAQHYDSNDRNRIDGDVNIITHAHQIDILCTQSYCPFALAVPGEHVRQPVVQVWPGLKWSHLPVVLRNNVATSLGALFLSLVTHAINSVSFIKLLSLASLTV